MGKYLNMETEWEHVEEHDRKMIEELFSGGNLTDLLIRTKDRMVVPSRLVPMLDTIRQLEVREDDIFILSYPKCGTTLTLQLAWLVSHQADVQTAASSRGSRCAFLEAPAIIGMSDWEAYYTDMDSVPSPRVFNSHLRLDMLPRDMLRGKVVVVVRDVKDCVVSYYHHNRLLKCHNYKGDFNKFRSLFQFGLLPYGSYSQMLGNLCQIRTHPNVKMLRYEDLVTDTMGNIRDMATFLGYSLTKEQEEMVAEFVQFDNYKENCQLGNKEGWNKGEGHFVRKGKVGDWENYFTQEEGRELDNWVEEEFSKLGIDKTPFVQLNRK